jgi:hypothetical protein
MIESLDNEDRQAVADLCRQHMAADVRELIATAASVQERHDAGELPDELSRRRLSNARAHLLESAQLGMAQGLSRLEVHTSILAAARRHAITSEVRLVLYEVIEEIGPD